MEDTMDRSKLCRLLGFLVASILAGPPFLLAGDNVWTGGMPYRAASAPLLVAADHSDPQVVYGAFGSDLFRSSDGGRGWTLIKSFDTVTDYDNILSLLVSPASSSTLFAGVRWPETALFKSTDGGATWASSLAGRPVTALAAVADEPTTIYAGTGYGEVYSTEDDGGSWSNSANPGIVRKISTLLFPPQSRGSLYVGGGEDLDYPFYYPATFLFHKSADAGGTWEPISRDANLPATGAAETMLFDPTNSSRLFLGVSNSVRNGLFQSNDGGATWAPSSAGLPDSPVYDIVADPLTPGTFFAATDAGVYRTRDSGGTWLPFGRQIADLWVKSLTLHGNTLYAATNGGVFSLELRQGAVDVSAGAGKTRLLNWNLDRLSIRTVEAGGGTSTPEVGPFGSWTAVAIADGPDGLSRVLWVNGDGQTGVEIVGSSGSQAAFRFPVLPGWTAGDISVSSDGTVHVLRTKSNGAMTIASVDSHGAATNGQFFPPVRGWSAIAIADAPDGSTWSLWRSFDGRWSLDRQRAGVSDTVFRFGAEPDWAVEDVSVGADGQPRVLRTRRDGTAEVSTVDAQGRLLFRRTYEKPGDGARRISAGPDGLTRLLWGRSGGDQVWLLNADNERQ
jgi:hypothetical protein